MAEGYEHAAEPPMVGAVMTLRMKDTEIIGQTRFRLTVIAIGERTFTIPPTKK